MKRRGGCSWSAMVSKGPREFGGVAFLLAVHVLIPLHPLRMTLGVVRDGPRRVARRLLRQQRCRKNPGLTMVVENLPCVICTRAEPPSTARPLSQKATRCLGCQLRSLGGIAAVDGEGDSDDKAGARAAQP